MTSPLIFAIILHFISDFLLQSREVAKNKSSSWKHLGKHIGIIFVCFLPFGLKISAANAIVHGVIDKFIWNLYKYNVMKRISKDKKHLLIDQLEAKANWKYWEDHWFYATIGLDQLLHTLS